MIKVQASMLEPDEPKNTINGQKTKLGKYQTQSIGGNVSGTGLLGDQQNYRN